jgi:putative transposase
MQLIQERPADVSLYEACDAIGFPRASYYRTLKPAIKRPKKRSGRALSEAERHQALEVLHSPRFVDTAPAEIVAQLLDDGHYIASERTFYRLLKERNEVKDRRRQRKHPVYSKPELLATSPNQLWSWDITKLRGPRRLEYYQLYVMLDVYSRYVVGWLLARVESSTLAKKLIKESCDREKISPDQLIIHSDRGPSMKSKTVAELLDQLSVLKSHSRPHVSNDNPYSESLFKTAKYNLSYPDRFGSYEDAQTFCRSFFNWYNHEHCHSGLEMLTPSDVHYGKAKKRLEHRHEVMQKAFESKPERFVLGEPKLKELAAEVWINAPTKQPVKSEPCGANPPSALMAGLMGSAATVKGGAAGVSAPLTGASTPKSCHLAGGGVDCP